MADAITGRQDAGQRPQPAKPDRRPPPGVLDSLPPHAAVPPPLTNRPATGLHADTLIVPGASPTFGATKPQAKSAGYAAPGTIKARHSVPTPSKSNPFPRRTLPSIPNNPSNSTPQVGPSTRPTPKRCLPTANTPRTSNTTGTLTPAPTVPLYQRGMPSLRQNICMAAASRIPGVRMTFLCGNDPFGQLGSGLAEITGFYVTDDVYAADVCRRLAATGRRLGCGVDMVTETETGFTPGLPPQVTRIEFVFVQMGSMAVSRLEHMLDHGETHLPTLRISGRMIPGAPAEA